WLAPGFLLLLGGVCLLCVWLSKPATEAKSIYSRRETQPTNSIQQAIIGKDCQQCHKLIVQTFPLDAHGKSARFLKDSRAAACEACHRNSEKHAEPSTRTKMGEPADSPANPTATQKNEACLLCHSRDSTHFAWRGGQHDRDDMSCLSCHSVHHVK